MLKKVLFLLVLCFVLTACNSEPETIEGYWMAENGDTISFNSDGKAIIDGFSYDYSIYNENYVSISFWGFAEEYRFEIESDILKLTDLSTNASQKLYRGEEKQSEIQANLDKLEAERAEEEKKQKEIEEYEKFINDLKSTVDTIDDEISNTYKSIKDNEYWIATTEDWIQDELNWINEIETEIITLQQSIEGIDEERIEDLRGQQMQSNQIIEDYRREIDNYTTEIAQFYQDIVMLEKDRKEIVTALQEMGEY